MRKEALKVATKTTAVPDEDQPNKPVTAEQEQQAKEAFTSLCALFLPDILKGLRTIGHMGLANMLYERDQRCRRMTTAYRAHISYQEADAMWRKLEEGRRGDHGE